MIERYTRAKLETLLSPLAQYCVRKKLHPNTMTCIGLLLGMSSGVTRLFDIATLSLLLLWLSGAADLLDGMMARMTDTTTQKGMFLDLISDRIVEVCFVIGSTTYYPPSLHAGLIFVSTLLIHFATSIALGLLTQNTSAKGMHYQQYFFERAEAFILFSLILILPAYTSIFLYFASSCMLCSILNNGYQLIHAPLTRS